jgi:Arc/MetJ-type ribon-helix-helix transcriptional regulator
LADESMAYIEEQIRSGRARSRAEVISRALAREARRERAARDLELILADRGAADDVDALAASVSATALDLE